jgi:methionyl-tRNA formyltransferase
MNIIFFGSTSDSVIVLDKLINFPFSEFRLLLSAIVTQPPSPIGRKQIITPTPVESWAKEHNIPITSFGNDPKKPWLFQNEEDVVNTLSTFKPDLLISACYGVKIPQQILKKAKFKGLNIHPSLLPRWRGADPVPWTILSGDEQTGVTVVTMTEQFDRGKIISQKKIQVTDKDLPDPLRKTLFTYGADLLISSLPDYLSGKNKGVNQKSEHAIYARRLTRSDGFIPWDHLQTAMEGGDVPREKRNGILTSVLCPLPSAITRAIRALSPWPGGWTLINPTNPTNLQIRQIKKRLKIIKAHVENEKLILDTVHLEGKNPVPWKQFKEAYLFVIARSETTKQSLK